jgi:mutator protein MutT
MGSGRTTKRVDVALAIVSRDGQVLICLRRAKDRLGGFWEFPGGKAEDGESISRCLARELREELDIAAEPLFSLPVIEHDYPDIHVRLHPFICAYKSGDAKPLGCDELRWVRPDELIDYQFPPANKELLDQVRRALAK